MLEIGLFQCLRCIDVFAGALEGSWHCPRCGMHCKQGRRPIPVQVDDFDGGQTWRTLEEAASTAAERRGS